MGACLYLEQLQLDLCVDSTKSQAPTFNSVSSSAVPLGAVAENFRLWGKNKQELFITSKSLNTVYFKPTGISFFVFNKQPQRCFPDCALWL